MVQAVTLEQFMAMWHDDGSTLEVHTSGSTGVPKRILAEKSRMLASARITCDYLGLKQGDTALLCLPLEYIAGKMMVVRSLERGLRLISIAPSSHPLREVTESIDFCAMVPMQVISSLSDPVESERLRRIRHLIIGGGAVDRDLENRLRDFPNSVWSTYGMTETLSHIALRRLSGPSASEWYQPFEGVSVNLTEDSRLIIHAPAVSQDTLITNDIAEINPQGMFRILGRSDNVINSGGIKVQPEQVEASLYEQLPHLVDRVCITSRPDPTLGERVVLVLEDSIGTEDILHLQEVISTLPRHQQPREQITVSHIPLTATGKINRPALRLCASDERRDTKHNHG